MASEIKDRPDLDALVALISISWSVVEGPLHNKAEFWHEKFVQERDALLPLITCLRHYQRVPSAFHDVFTAALLSTLAAYLQCARIQEEFISFVEHRVAEAKERLWWLTAEERRLERIVGKFLSPDADTVH